MKFHAIITFILCLAAVGPSFASDGLVKLKSNHDVETTTERLEEILNRKGLTVFTTINHAEAAAAEGIELRPSQLIVFGNPSVGSYLIKCSQTVAIDLPQKALIYQDEQGDVWIAYNDPRYLVKRHDIEGCRKIIMNIENGLNAINSEVAK